MNRLPAGQPDARGDGDGGVFTPDRRVIEFGGSDLAVARWLRDEGVQRYLGLFEPAALGDLGDDDEHLAPRSLAWTDFDTIGQNNADVLILRGDARRAIWSEDMWQRSLYVVMEAGADRDSAADLLGWMRQRIAGRLVYLGSHRIDDGSGGRRTLLINRVAEPKRNPKPRRYLTPLMGVRGFFDHLNASGMRYAVLRWFDRLPAVGPGEDIDMLIADEDLPALAALFDAEPGVIPFDVYSVSGLPGTHYHNVAYFPPPLAERLLDRAVRRNGIRVPSPDDHFDSLAYHALYQKGEASGLATTTVDCRPVERPKRDFAGALTSLGEAVGISCPATMESLDELLAERGWRPPHDTLLTLSGLNRWVSNRFFPTCEVPPADERGLAVFVVRERGVELGMVEEIERLLVARGFHLLARKDLSDGDREACRLRMRGGNWSAALDPVSGGGPAVVLVTGDPMPARVPPHLRDECPHSDNARVISAKRRIRDALNRRLPADEHCNVLHSSDNDEQARQYIRIAMPEQEEAILAQMRGLHEAFAPSPERRATLTAYGMRARLEVVEDAGRMVVRKTFRPGCEVYAARERFVMEDLGRDCNAVPPLLDASDRSVTMPHYDDVLANAKRRGRLLPLKVVRQAVDAIAYFHRRGYTLIDFHPLNVLLDRRHGVKIVDFEYCQRYENTPPSLDACYELAGVPDDFGGDRPELVDYLGDPYTIMWRPYTGLSLRSLLHDPVWLQHLKRTAERARRAASSIGSAWQAGAGAVGGWIDRVLLPFGERRIAAMKERKTIPPAVTAAAHESSPQHHRPERPAEPAGAARPELVQE